MRVRAKIKPPVGKKIKVQKPPVMFQLSKLKKRKKVQPIQKHIPVDLNKVGAIAPSPCTRVFYGGELGHLNTALLTKHPGYALDFEKCKTAKQIT